MVSALRPTHTHSVNRYSRLHSIQHKWHSNQTAKINLSTEIHFVKCLSYHKLVCLFVIYLLGYLFVCFFRPLFFLYTPGQTSQANTFFPLPKHQCCSMLYTYRRKKMKDFWMLNLQTTTKMFLFLSLSSSKNPLLRKNRANV